MLVATCPPQTHPPHDRLLGHLTSPPGCCVALRHAVELRPPRAESHRLIGGRLYRSSSPPFGRLPCRASQPSVAERGQVSPPKVERGSQRVSLAPRADVAAASGHASPTGLQVQGTPEVSAKRLAGALRSTGRSRKLPTCRKCGDRVGLRASGPAPRTLHAVPVTSQREVDPNRHARVCPAVERWDSLPPSMGFVALRRLRMRVATCTGSASPGCAAPPGFLNLLTLCSTRNLSSLVSCRKRPWASRFRRVSLARSGPTSRRVLPFLPFLDRVHRRPGQDEPDLGFKGLRIQRIRTTQTGVTRGLWADPPIAFTSSRYPPTRPRLRASTEPPLMGFYTTLNGRPLIAVVALQSVKEPRGGPVSFETGRPP